MKIKFLNKALILCLILMVFFALPAFADNQTTIETEATAEIETEAETEAATEAETEAETEATTEAETEGETEAKTEAEKETEAETEAETEPELKSVTSVTTDYYTDITEYAKAFKKGLLAHEETIVLYYVGEDENDRPSEAYTLATEHTGNGAEGDYLRTIIKAQFIDITKYGEFKEGYLFRYAYTISYYTTKSQEDYVASKVNSIISSLSLSGKSDYQKVKAIHDYMTKNFSQANTETTTYEGRCSAYVLLKNKSGNCMAFASLFYRLCLSAGVDARYISGGGHAWNIVKVDGTYYCIDVMWDTVAGDKYFLKGTTGFMTNHTAASDCYSNYNVSSTDYVVTATTSEEKETAKSSSSSGSAKTTSGSGSTETTTGAGDETDETEGAEETTEEENNFDSLLKLHDAYIDIYVANRMQLARYGKAFDERRASMLRGASRILLSPFSAAGHNKFTFEFTPQNS